MQRYKIKCKVSSNLLKKYLKRRKQYDNETDVRDVLTKHITNPVRFEDGIKEMIDMGIDTFVEIGPGKTLTGFVKKIDRFAKVININSSESLKLALEELGV